MAFGPCHGFCCAAGGHFHGKVGGIRTAATCWRRPIFFCHAPAPSHSLLLGAKTRCCTIVGGSCKTRPWRPGLLWVAPERPMLGVHACACLGMVVWPPRCHWSLVVAHACCHHLYTAAGRHGQPATTTWRWQCQWQCQCTGPTCQRRSTPGRWDTCSRCSPPQPLARSSVCAAPRSPRAGLLWAGRRVVLHKLRCGYHKCKPTAG